MREQFKVGDRVRVVSPRSCLKGETGIIRGIVSSGLSVKLDSDPTRGTCWFGFSEAEVLQQQPSVASDLRLTPQAKSVLLHLRKHGRITPVKADVNYGITRLASCIHEIRKVGYDVTTTVERDEGGHKFANYKLATVN